MSDPTDMSFSDLWDGMLGELGWGPPMAEADQQDHLDTLDSIAGKYLTADQRLRLKSDLSHWMESFAPSADASADKTQSQKTADAMSWVLGPAGLFGRWLGGGFPGAEVD